MGVKKRLFRGKGLRLVVFDLLVVLSLLLNVWAFTESGKMEGKIDALGEELTTLNGTLDYRAPSVCSLQSPPKISQTVIDDDG
jgi:hypothetical protein